MSKEKKDFFERTSSGGSSEKTSDVISNERNLSPQNLEFFGIKEESSWTSGPQGILKYFNQPVSSEPPSSKLTGQLKEEEIIRSRRRRSRSVTSLDLSPAEEERLLEQMDSKLRKKSSEKRNLNRKERRALEMMDKDPPNKCLFHCCVSGDYKNAEYVIKSRGAELAYRIDENDPLLSSRYLSVGDTPLSVAKRYNNHEVYTLLRREIKRSGVQVDEDETADLDIYSPDKDFLSTLRGIKMKKKKKNKTESKEKSKDTPKMGKKRSNKKLDEIGNSPVTVEKRASPRLQRNLSGKARAIRSQQSKTDLSTSSGKLISDKDKSRSQRERMSLKEGEKGEKGEKGGEKGEREKGEREGVGDFSSPAKGMGLSPLSPIEIAKLAGLEAQAVQSTMGFLSFCQEGDELNGDPKIEMTTRGRSYSTLTKSQALEEQKSSAIGFLRVLDGEGSEMREKNKSKVVLEEDLTPLSLSSIFDLLSSTTWTFNSEFLHFFFLTYCLFTDWESVVVGLVSRWSKDAANSILMCFKYWVTNHCEDWKGKEEIFHSLTRKHGSLNEIETRDLLKLCNTMLVSEVSSRVSVEYKKDDKTSRKRSRSRGEGNFSRPGSRIEHFSGKKKTLKAYGLKADITGSIPNGSGSPVGNGWFMWDEVLVADQLSLLHWNLFKAIPPREFILWKQSKNNKKEVCSNLWNLIQHFNKIAYWVIGEIVVRVRLVERVTLVEKFIQISFLCLHIQNFFGAKALFTGITHPSISRMSKTMDAISRESKYKFTKLHRVLEIDSSNGALYRQTLKGASPPYIPHLGLHLKDHVFLIDAPAKDGEINVPNLFSVWKSVSSLLKGASVEYETQVDQLVYIFLRDVPSMDADLVFVWSSRVEPKNMETQIAKFIDEELRLQKRVQQMSTHTEALELQVAEYKKELEASKKLNRKLMEKLRTSGEPFSPISPERNLPDEVKEKEEKVEEKREIGLEKSGKGIEKGLDLEALKDDDDDEFEDEYWELIRKKRARSRGASVALDLPDHLSAVLREEVSLTVSNVTELSDDDEDFLCDEL